MRKLICTSCIIAFIASSDLQAQSKPDTTLTNNQLVQPIYIQNIKGVEAERNWVEKYGTLIPFFGTLLTLMFSLIITERSNKMNAKNTRESIRQNTENMKEQLDANRANLNEQLTANAKNLDKQLNRNSEEERRINIRNTLASLLYLYEHLTELRANKIPDDDPEYKDTKKKMNMDFNMLMFILDHEDDWEKQIPGKTIALRDLAEGEDLADDDPGYVPKYDKLRAEIWAISFKKIFKKNT